MTGSRQSRGSIKDYEFLRNNPELLERRISLDNNKSDAAANARRISMDNLIDAQPHRTRQMEDLSRLHPGVIMAAEKAEFSGEHHVPLPPPGRNKHAVRQLNVQSCCYFQREREQWVVYYTRP